MATIYDACAATCENKKADHFSNLGPITSTMHPDQHDVCAAIYENKDVFQLLIDIQVVLGQDALTLNNMKIRRNNRSRHTTSSS